MKVLLISPTSKFTEFASFAPPLGLAYIAAILEKNGHKVKIIDMNLNQNSKNIILNSLNQFDLIGISALTPMYSTSKELIKEIRARDKDIPIIMGGSHPTIMPEEVLNQNEITAVIRGEGEITTLDLIKYVKGKMPLTKIKGISYRSKKDIKHNLPRESANIDKLPFPARHLIPIREYNYYVAGRFATTTISSRGCPFGCVYCSQSVGKKWRGISPKRFVDEIEHEIMDKYKIKGVYLYDDLFAFDKQRVIGICNEIIKRKLDLRWQCFARVDLVDKEMLTKMKQSGCVNIHYGIEAGDQKSLDMMRKGITLKQAEKALKITKEVGIYSKAFFMMGFPWETKDTIKNTVKFAKKLPADHVQFTVVTPYPGTELWKIAINQGIINPKNVDYDSLYLITPDLSERVYFTNNLTEKEVIKLRKKAYRKLIFNKVFDKIKKGDFKYIFDTYKQKRKVGGLKFFKKLLLGI